MATKRIPAKKAAKRVPAKKAAKRVPAKKAAAPAKKAVKKVPAKKAASGAGGATVSGDASKLIDARIKELDDWRGETLARLRTLIQKRIPTWSRNGSGEGFLSGTTTE